MAQDDIRDELRQITEMRDRWRAVIAEAEGQLLRLDWLYAKASGEPVTARHRRQGTHTYLRVVRGAVISAGLAAAELLHKKAVASITATAAASVVAVGLAGPVVSPHLWSATHAPGLAAPAVHALQTPRRRRVAEVRLQQPAASTRRVDGTGHVRHHRGMPSSPATSPATAAPGVSVSVPPVVSVSLPVPVPVPSVSVSLPSPEPSPAPRHRRHLLPRPVRSLVPVLLPSPPPGCTVDVLGICVGIKGGTNDG